MAIDASTIQAVLTGIFGALTAVFGHKAYKSKADFNGHLDEFARYQARQILHGRRLTKLEEENKDLRRRVTMLEGGDPQES